MSKKESKKAEIARPKKEAEEVARKVEDFKKKLKLQREDANR